MGLLLWLQGGWGVTPSTEKFRCEPPAPPRNSGTDYVVSTLCFALVLLGFAVAFTLLKPAAGATPRGLLIIAFVSIAGF